MVDKHRARDWFHAWRAAEISLSHKWATWPRMCANDLTEVIQLILDARSPNYKSIVLITRTCDYLKVKNLKWYLKCIKSICYSEILYIYIAENTIIPLLSLKNCLPNVLMFNLLDDIAKSCVVLECTVNVIRDWKVPFFCDYSSSTSFESGTDSEDIKKACSLLIRQLYILMQNLGPLPNDVILTMKLHYYNSGR
jgi:hypothetical protein